MDYYTQDYSQVTRSGKHTGFYKPIKPRIYLLQTHSVFDRQIWSRREDLEKVTAEGFLRMPRHATYSEI